MHYALLMQFSNLRKLPSLVNPFGLTCPEVCCTVSSGFFRLLVCSCLVSSVIYHEAFCLYVATNYGHSVYTLQPIMGTLFIRCNQLWGILFIRCNQLWGILFIRCNQLWGILFIRFNQLWGTVFIRCNQL
jgi:hypothetical protein